jgi:hypothetical protein
MYWEDVAVPFVFFVIVFLAVILGTVVSNSIIGNANATPHVQVIHAANVPVEVTGYGTVSSGNIAEAVIFVSRTDGSKTYELPHSFRIDPRDLEGCK